MCGIAGIIARDEADVVEHALDAMVRALRHRGPDSNGCRVERAGEWNIGLGHARLAILDLSAAGNQPMANSDRTAWIAFNGEIYNFLQLRRELEVEGARFTSRTDTEVIIKAHERWGLECLPRLRGMFAYGLWDGAEGRLLLARDSLGIKPLYIYRSGDRLLFASEVRALLASGLVPRTLSPDGVASYLQSGSLVTPHTVIRGVESMRPGECLSVRAARSLEVERSFFEGPAATLGDSQPRDRRHAAGELRDLLRESVKQHLVSDVPVGLFLSGGIDSTALLGFMSEFVHNNVRTFNVTFTESGYAEGSYAKEAAAKFGAEHTEILLTEQGLLDMLPEALCSMDQPTMDGVNTFVVAREVRNRGLKVALSGLGGDELFGGYASFSRARLLKQAGRVPWPLRRAASFAGRTLWNPSVARDKFWDLLASQARPEDAYLISRRLFAPTEIRELAGRPAPEVRLPEAGADLINAVSVLELRGYMTETLLRDTDFMSMAHALEVRVPFVDSPVLNYVLRLPGEWKVDRRRPKPLLLDAAAGAIPERIWRRRKMGFAFPFKRWLLSALAPELERTFSAGAMTEIGIGSHAARTVWNRFRQAPDRERWSRPWALYILRKWCEANEVHA